MSDSPAEKPRSTSLAQALSSSSSSASGEPKYGSATTHGPGLGNKTGEFRKDSLRGSAMQSVGKVLHNDGLAAKGEALRRSHGWEG